MKQGFTLVELAIVLVIIGLLVGGVLQGQELIRVAKINSQISQIDKFNISVNTFRSKYNCIPGDCKKAQAFGLGVGAGPGENGTGDQLIAYYNSTVAAFATSNTQNYYHFESFNFWYHLQQAELIEGSYSGHTNQTNFNTLAVAEAAAPKTKIAEDGYIMPTVFAGNIYGNGYTQSFKNGYWLFGIGAGGGGYPSGVVLSTLARSLDSKIDDGIRTTDFVVEASYPANFYPNLCNAATCNFGSPTEYSTDESSKITLAISRQF